MQPAKLVQLRKPAALPSDGLSKAFGVEPSAARLTCSLQSDVKDFAQRCADAAKIAGFALATSALVAAVSSPLLACFLVLLISSGRRWSSI